MWQAARVRVRCIHAVDAKWIKRWEASPPSLCKSTQKKEYYQLPMFPYPSGKLHIGHLRVYTISDTLARFRRMRGYKVIHPHGWDAFGLPAENAAIEHGVSARDWTYRHIDAMRDQIKRMLVSFDWDREIITCDKDYYKHTQQIFLQLYRRELAYRKRAVVNWDPVDKTVLANEQIDSQGRSWRSGAVAEQRELEQWFLRITAYSKALEGDLSLLTDWPEEVKKMQKQWIGLSNGVEVEFGKDLVCFTTKVETLPGVKFVAIAHTHPLAKSNAANTRPSGLIEGVDALNPLTGEPVPVYVADYVVEGYGTEAVMGVPAHDERDAKFWEEVAPSVAKTDVVTPVYDVNTNSMVSGPANLVGKPVKEARSQIIKELHAAGKAEEVTKTRLRDWLVSRQRFWGAPIPMVHCKSGCGVVPVPDDQLPVELPKDVKNVPLSANEEWIRTTCPECGGPASRDPDTMDTFMDSSWYYFRYLDVHNTGLPFSNTKVNGHIPVDCYVGGIEHAILHLLYSRFIAKALRDSSMWDGGDLSGEPFRKLVTQGMVHGITYRERESGRYLKPEEVKKLNGDLSGVELSMEKMSKSKYNGVDPLEVIDEHGADATRAHMLFQAPVQDTLVWDTKKIVGIERWLSKVRSLASSFSGEKVANGSVESTTEWNSACELLDSITSSLENVSNLNTVISDYMKLTRVVQTLQKQNPKDASVIFECLLKSMAPVTPAVAEEFWETYLTSRKLPWQSVHSAPWPQLKKRAASGAEECEFKVILNSRPVKPVRAAANASEAELLALAGISAENVKRVVFKPGIRLLSIVTR